MILDGKKWGTGTFGKLNPPSVDVAKHGKEPAGGHWNFATFFKFKGAEGNGKISILFDQLKDAVKNGLYANKSHEPGGVIVANINAELNARGYRSMTEAEVDAIREGFSK